MVFLSNDSPFSKTVSRRIIGKRFNYLEIPPGNLLFLPLVRNSRSQKSLKDPRRIYYRIPETDIYFFKQLKQTNQAFLEGNFYIKEWYINKNSLGSIPSFLSFTFLKVSEWDLKSRKNISSLKRKKLEYFKNNLF